MINPYHNFLCCDITPLHPADVVVARLGSLSKALQTWLLMQRESLTASCLLLHMVSVFVVASSEVLRAVSSEILKVVS